MARGDVVGSAITSVASGGNLDFQPAAGVEVLMTVFAGGASNSVLQTYFDGTLEATIAGCGEVGRLAGKQMLTNAIYGRVANDNASTIVCVLRGVQTK